MPENSAPGGSAADAGELSAEDIQPVDNETRDRIITGIVTFIPFAGLGFVATLVLIRTRDSRAHVEMANAQAAPAEA